MFTKLIIIFLSQIMKCNAIETIDVIDSKVS